MKEEANMNRVTPFVFPMALWAPWLGWVMNCQKAWFQAWSSGALMGLPESACGQAAASLPVAPQRSVPRGKQESSPVPPVSEKVVSGSDVGAKVPHLGCVGPADLFDSEATKPAPSAFAAVLATVAPVTQSVTQKVAAKPVVKKAPAPAVKKVAAKKAPVKSVAAVPDAAQVTSPAQKPSAALPAAKPAAKAQAVRSGVAKAGSGKAVPASKASAKAAADKAGKS